MESSNTADGTKYGGLEIETMEKGEELVIDSTVAREAAKAAATVPVGGLLFTHAEYKIHRRINLKMDFGILGYLTFMFLFNAIDRSNLGSAQTANFAQDVGVPLDSINQATTLFYVTWQSFVSCQLRSRSGSGVGITNFIPIVMTCWGAFTIAHAFVHNEAQLIAYRLMIGAFESGFYPLCVYYYSACYIRYDLAYRLGIFYGAYSIAGAFSGVIAYGLLQLHGSLRPWQWLFVIEGVVTITLAILGWFVLPARPENAWFLTPEEKVFAADRMLRDSGGEDYSGRTISMRDVKQLVVDWKLYIMWPCNMLCGLCQSAFGVFLPIIVQQLGYEGYRANLYSVPIYVVGAVGLWVVTFISDHWRERLYLILFSLSFVILGGVLVNTLHSPHARYAALCIMQIGNFAMSPLQVTLLANNTPTPGHRAILLATNSMCNINGVISAQLFLPKYAPTYRKPFWISMGLCCFSFTGYCLFRILLVRVNAWRARKIARLTPEEIDAEIQGSTRLGDKKWTFQYST